MPHVLKYALVVTISSWSTCTPWLLPWSDQLAICWWKSLQTSWISEETQQGFQLKANKGWIHRVQQGCSQNTCILHADHLCCRSGWSITFACLKVTATSPPFPLCKWWLSHVSPAADNCRAWPREHNKAPIWSLMVLNCVVWAVWWSENNQSCISENAGNNWKQYM